MVLSNEPENKVSPSGEIHNDLMASEWPFSLARQDPDDISHTLIVLPLKLLTNLLTPTENNASPSGEIHKDMTALEWPFNTAQQDSEAMFHTLMVLSSEPENKVSPSGEIHNEVT